MTEDYCEACAQGFHDPDENGTCLCCGYQEPKVKKDPMAEYAKLIYHQRPTELAQMVVHNELRKAVADSIWHPTEDNAAQYGFIWHFGFPATWAEWGQGWDGYIEDDEPNGFGSQRWRINHDHDIPELECEEV